MGRRRKGKSVEVKLLVPEMIYLEFERELTNGFQSKPIYGARSQIVTSLIVQWIKAKRKARAEAESKTPEKKEDLDV